MYATDRQKELYEVLNPETRLGGVGRGEKKVRQNGEPSFADRFTKDRAAEMNKAERTIQHLVKPGVELGGARLERIAGTSPSSGVEKDALTKMVCPQQRTEINMSSPEKTKTAFAALLQSLGVEPGAPVSMYEIARPLVAHGFSQDSIALALYDLKDEKIMDLIEGNRQVLVRPI